MEDLILAAELLVAYLKKVWGPMEHWDESRRFVVNQMVLEINEARTAKNAEPPAIPQQPLCAAGDAKLPDYKKALGLINPRVFIVKRDREMFELGCLEMYKFLSGNFTKR